MVPGRNGETGTRVLSRVVTGHRVGSVPARTPNLSIEGTTAWEIMNKIKIVTMQLIVPVSKGNPSYR